MSILDSRFWLLDSARSGQATLSLVFLVGGLIVLVGVSLAFILISFISSGYGFRVSNQALSVAMAGAEDAVMQLVRNKGFSSLGGYSVPVGSWSANVTVTPDSPVSGQDTINSAATISGYQRKIQVVVAVVSSTGQVDVVSWNQLAL